MNRYQHNAGILPLLHGGVLAAMLLLLGGCAEPWKAPVDRRSSPSRGAVISGDTYRVQSGDTMYGIAWRAGLDYRELAAWNGIGRPYTIYVGQKLRLKAPSGGDRASGMTEKQLETSVASAVAVERTEPDAKASGGESASVPSTISPQSQPEIAAAGGPLRWHWPTRGKVVQTFSSRDPGRKGIKIAGSKGQPVSAAEAGEVVYSGSGLVGYGQLIIVKHNNDYLSAYGHNDKRLVKEGDRVARGDVIGHMGIAGGQPVLHFEIRRRGKPVDPVGLLPKL